MSTFYDQLDELDDYMVTIWSRRVGTLRGLIDTDEISYTNAANIGSSTLAGITEGFIKGAAKGMAKKVFGDLGRSLVSDNFKTVMSTFKGYEDSSHSGFGISMHLFPNKFGNGSYKEIMDLLGRMTLPDTTEDTFLKSYLYSPEDLKALASGEDPFKGNLIHVTIGNWFHATGLFMEQGSPSFSKFVDTNGDPIYAKVDPTFTSYKVLNATEWSSWWKR